MSQSLRQASLDELGTPLAEVVFVVLDLETNGGPNHEGGITEIGAVKVSGGQVIGEFQTLVNPGTEIPPFIELLTGISREMLADQPELATVLPMFWQWAGDSVLVAHNAGFDIGFLKAAGQLHAIPWHSPRVLDTLTLAKAALTRDEVPNRKLATLAAFFKSPTEPVHRALADARATVHVLHGLLERLGSFGVTTLEDLQEVGTVINARHRQKRHLAADLPDGPGVYFFRDDRGRTLYVGKSKSLRKRVLTYFTKSEQRSHIGRMVDLTESVGFMKCATELEAGVRELRLLQEHKPAFNRASTRTESSVWLRLTREPYPRLSVVRQVRADLGLIHLGPLSNREQAALVIDAITTTIGLRTCTPKLSPARATSACALADMGRCAAPCELRISVPDYAELVARLQSAVAGDDCVERELSERINRLAAAERYEEAAANRDRLAAWLLVAARNQRLASLTRVAELVAAAPSADGGWDVHVIRHGALAAAGRAESFERAHELGASLGLSAQVFAKPESPAPAGLVSEANLVLRWLEHDGARLIAVSDTWRSPWPSQMGSQQQAAEMWQARQLSAGVVPVRRSADFRAPR